MQQFKLKDDFSIVQTNFTRIAATKRDINLVLSFTIFLLVTIGFLLDKYFIIELHNKVEVNMIDKVFGNLSLIELNKNDTIRESCKKMINNKTILKFRVNIDSYESNKYKAEIATQIDLGICLLLLIALLVLFKYDSDSLIINKACFVLAATFAFTEYISLILYLSLYLKAYHLYTFVFDSNKCYFEYMFDSVDENIAYQLFINSFLPEVEFVYSCIIVLILLHFGNLIIVLYKMKLLIVLNLTHKSINCLIEDDTISNSKN
jgi:hypothetical protein